MFSSIKCSAEWCARHYKLDAAAIPILHTGIDTGLDVASLESLVPLMDSHRSGRPTALVERLYVGDAHEFPVARDGRRLRPSPVRTDDVVAVADTPSGGFASIVPCSATR